MAGWLKPSLTSPGFRWLATGIFTLGGILVGVIAVVRLGDDQGAETYPWSALIVASAGLLVILGFLEAVGSTVPNAERKKYGWVGILLGADGRISTSKTQTWLWTLGLATAFLYLTGIVVFGPAGADKLWDKTDWDQYFLLLGGPFAAGVLAKLTVVTKIQNGSLQQTTTNAASPDALQSAGAATSDEVAKARDVVSTDSGEIDVVDSQYLVFNVVAFIYIAAAYISSVLDADPADRIAPFALPNVPSVLLGLTSLSALTYVANKTAQKSGPRIVSVSPDPATGGAAMRILGVNLVPAGASGEAARAGTSVALSVDDGSESAVLAPTAAPDPTLVQFQLPPRFAPSDGSARTVHVRVITLGGVATGPYPLQVTA